MLAGLRGVVAQKQARAYHVGYSCLKLIPKGMLLGNVAEFFDSTSDRVGCRKVVHFLNQCNSVLGTGESLLFLI